MIEITKRKNFIPVTDELISYLDQFGRCHALPTTYAELRSFSDSYPHFDKDGNATHWSSVMYPREIQQEIYPKLTSIYSLLRTGDLHAVPHLYVERVDYCEFGNSRPFRIRVVNQYNDNYDHFYVKTADASRVYGLELEHLLSPNRINYLMHRGGTLVEEHIAGIPGDVFMRDYLHRPDLNRVRLAKEFVKFSERCFIRLLGDMRSYNYVVDMTPDFEEVQYRVRAIDFDQQSYEGRKNLYLPQFFKENNLVVQLCSACLNFPTMKQYQEEERSLISRRYLSERQRITALLRCMKGNPVEPFEKVIQLRAELGQYHNTHLFDSCKSMGDIVEKNLEILLGRHLE
ncbi:MAG: hypothetical protein IAE77_27330 [Prosthecobacter sp.]|uniref:hypothetical protein n=1 Tax=Prosthecobacter sp. TaxID=1965333 RepID=UPI0019DB97D5|nr:hypothetical protein [Prosthecobacter sp.]MBE2287198.1 hypothetical protein [Prosthecobacter sp.]